MGTENDQNITGPIAPYHCVGLALARSRYTREQAERRGRRIIEDTLAAHGDLTPTGPVTVRQEGDWWVVDQPVERAEPRRMSILEWLDRGGPQWLEWVDPRNVIPHIRLWHCRRLERAAWRRHQRMWRP